MAGVAGALTRERIVMLALLMLAALSCALGVLAKPPVDPATSNGEQLLDLVRVLGAVALALSLLIGPGVAWRALADRERSLSLGFLALPGLLLLIGTGALAWALSHVSEPRLTCYAVALPVLLGLAASLLLSEPGELFNREERRCLLVVGCVLGLAVARALWSLGPEGELYGGTVSRTLEVGDRSDSRISFIVPQLVANHTGPYGPLGVAQFSPYNFSSRGPLPGLASTPVVLMSGGRPPAALPEQPWTPFDAQGFQAYRLAMITFACTAFLSLWDLTRRLAGRTAGYLALLLAATTPFLVHEVWFTWPKMLAASMVLLAAICVISRRPLAAGLLIGFGYLMHPVALLSLPALALIALWPLRGARWNRPQVKQLLWVGAGVGTFLVIWRIANGSHYDQNGFLNYFTQGGAEAHPPVGVWLEARLKSLGNTVVPLLLPIASADNPSINQYAGSSPGVIRFFFQYWNTFPFGVAIVFFPFLLVSLWRALRRWPWAVLAVVIFPFALFTVYWGSFETGMMREGLQTWALTLFAVIACEQAATGFGWLRSLPVRIVLVLRMVEVMAVVAVPTLATRHEILGNGFALSDTAAVLAMLAFGVGLATLVWSAKAPDAREGMNETTSTTEGERSLR